MSVKQNDAILQIFVFCVINLVGEIDLLTVFQDWQILTGKKEIAT
jgi:hypothetical protein